MTPEEMYDAMDDQCETVWTVIRNEEQEPDDTERAMASIGVILIGPVGEVLTVRCGLDPVGHPHVVVEGFNSSCERVEPDVLVLGSTVAVHGDKLDSRPICDSMP